MRLCRTDVGSASVETRTSARSARLIVPTSVALRLVIEADSQQVPLERLRGHVETAMATVEARPDAGADQRTHSYVVDFVAWTSELAPSKAPDDVEPANLDRPLCHEHGEFLTVPKGV